MAGYNNFQTGYGYPMYSTAGYQAYQQTPQQYQQQTGTSYQQAQPVGIVWVDGEVGAKAYQLPQGWPVNAPMPLWDTNDTVIYLKSTNQMGMPNPLQKVHYTMEEVQRGPVNAQSGAQQPMLPAGTNGDGVTKHDLEALKKEIMEALNDGKGAKSNGKSAV